MLQSSKSISKLKAAVKANDLRLAIVASEYNKRYVESMLKAACEEIVKCGWPRPEVVRVPGAYEIPVTVANLLHHSVRPYDAVICLGVILEGATSHARNICEAVTQSLSLLQIQTRIPVIHEVLHVTNKDQAEARCIDPRFNRGREAATTAMRMAKLMRRIRSCTPPFP